MDSNLVRMWEDASTPVTLSSFHSPFSCWGYLQALVTETVAYESHFLAHQYDQRNLTLRPPVWIWSSTGLTEIATSFGLAS